MLWESGGPASRDLSHSILSGPGDGPGLGSLGAPAGGRGTLGATARLLGANVGIAEGDRHGTRL